MKRIFIIISVLLTMVISVNASTDKQKSKTKVSEDSKSLEAQRATKNFLDLLFSGKFKEAENFLYTFDEKRTFPKDKIRNWQEQLRLEFKAHQNIVKEKEGSYSDLKFLNKLEKDGMLIICFRFKMKFKMNGKEIEHGRSDLLILEDLKGNWKLFHFD